MKIKFLDLHKNYLSNKNEIDNKITEIINNTAFINSKYISEFENNFAKYNNSKYCVGVANGTDALEIAVQSLDLPKDSEIITVGNTFVATCLSIVNNNYKMILCDINKDNYMMDVTKLEGLITEKTKAIIVVHLYGHAVDMDKIMEIAKKYNLYVIEDCAQSHGCLYKNKKVGSIGDIGCFSFYPGKNLGGFGDAGGIITNNDQLYDKCKKIKNLGSKVKYYHEIIGRNSRMDGLQAGILDVKLKYLDENNKKRLNNAKLYFKYLCNIDKIVLPKIEDYCVPVFHLFIIRVDNKKIRDDLRKYLEDNGIETGIHYPISINNMECFQNIELDKTEISNNYSERILSLPMYPELEEKEIKYVCDNINKYYN